jgi:hypothetical protein
MILNSVLNGGLHRGEDPVEAFAKGGDSEKQLVLLFVSSNITITYNAGHRADVIF